MKFSFFIILASMVTLYADNISLHITKFESQEGVATFPTFSFNLKNGNPKKNYCLTAENISGEIELLHSALKVNRKGELMDGPQPFQLSTVGTGPGEAIIFQASSADGKEKTRFTLIPRPLEVKENGYTLAVQLLDPGLKNFTIHAFGFEPNETIHFYTSSGNNELSKNLTATPGGEFHLSSKHAEEIKGGEVYVKIKGKNGHVAMTYPWGEAYQKELKEIFAGENILLKDY